MGLESRHASERIARAHQHCAGHAGGGPCDRQSTRSGSIGHGHKPFHGIAMSRSVYGGSRIASVADHIRLVFEDGGSGASTRHDGSRRLAARLRRNRHSRQGIAQTEQTRFQGGHGRRAFASNQCGDPPLGLFRARAAGHDRAYSHSFRRLAQGILHQRREHPVGFPHDRHCGIV